ncbi:MAG TPA: EamA family transporter [Gaiellaceae bacterium]|nr:EamA family transporter [Gaiellaceae bacterium]
MSHKARVWAVLITVYVLWGSTYLGIAVAGETIPPLFAASTRFIVAGGLMAAIVKLRRGSLRVSRRELVTCIAVGCLLPGANGILFFAERNVPTGLASLLIASVPLWVVVMRLTMRERLGGQVLIGVALGFVGVAVLAQPSGGATFWGIGLCVLSSVMWAGGSVISARGTMPTDAFVATAYEMLAGGFVMFVPSVFTVHHFSPSAGSIGGWVYLVTFGSLVGYTAYAWLLANAPLGLVSTYAYVNPIVAIALGVLFRGEHLSWRLLIGAIVVVAAVAAVVRQDPATAPASDEVPGLETDVVRLDRDAREVASGRGT